MKTRRVVVTIEMDTDIPTANLRSRSWWNAAMPYGWEVEVHQSQVNVVKQVKDKKKKKS